MDWLVPPERRKLTPNRYCKEDATRKVIASKPHLIEDVQGIVLHYTASGNTMGSVNWLCDKASGASAHFVIGQDGVVWQLAPLSDRTWHAGGATSTFLGKRNTNGRTIGIELVNYGILEWDDAKKGWMTWIDAEAKRKGKSYNLYTGDVAPDPKRPLIRAWCTYADTQIVALCELLHELVKLYPSIAADPDKLIVGHEDVDPMRKTDPGGAFPWKLVRDSVRATNAPDGCADGP